MDLSLTNKDLDPVGFSGRTWSASDYFSLWVGMSIQIPTYMMAASLIQGGMGWGEALGTIFLGNVIILAFILLSSHPGVKYGISFPVFARASFGILGANIPALLRALVSCGWFGIQTWIGGMAIYALVMMLFPTAGSVFGQFETLFQVNFVQFMCFLSFWLLNLFFIWQGIESIKILESFSAPLLIFGGLALVLWAQNASDSLGVLLSAPTQFETRAEFWTFFFPALTGIIGFWATLSLNISDFTRYASSQKSQLIGQSMGLPISMTLFAFVGILVTNATIFLYGEAIWDPLVLAQKFDGSFMVTLVLIGVVMATLTTNVAANMVSPANDFANLFPKYIDFKKGGLITGIIGILIQPWKLISDPSGYIFTWLIGYSALLGPIIGVLLADYYVIRKTALNTQHMYAQRGIYTYSKGFNMKAILALLLGILPNIPGFLNQIEVVSVTGPLEMLVPLYHYAWFIGLFISSVSYTILMRGAQVAPVRKTTSQAEHVEVAEAA